MCGIHGFVTGRKRNNTAEEYVMDGLVAGSLRGMDASGIASIDTDKGAFSIQKMPIPGFMLVRDKYTGVLARRACATHMITLCHTRSSTSGSDGLESAHPFVVDDEENMRSLVGVHNGTLERWKGKTNAKNFDVDSEWALNHIFDNGLHAFEDFHGSYSFVWWDSADGGTIHMARNKDRPMHFAFTDEDGMAFASEPGMLKWLCQRNNINLIDNTVYYTKPGYKYSFSTKSLRTFQQVPLPELKNTPAVVTHPPRGGYTNYGTSTTVERVDAMLAEIEKIGAKPENMPPFKQETVVTRVNKMNVTQKEIENARALECMNKEVLFAPEFYDSVTKELVGKGNLDGMVAQAKVRDASRLQWTSQVKYKLRCIGIIDDGTGIEIICSLPSKAPVMPESKDETVH